MCYTHNSSKDIKLQDLLALSSIFITPSTLLPRRIYLLSCLLSSIIISSLQSLLAPQISLLQLNSKFFDMAEIVGRYSAPLPNATAPPQYEMETPRSENGSPHFEPQTSHYEVQNTLTETASEKPIVVPRELQKLTYKPLNNPNNLNQNQPIYSSSRPSHPSQDATPQRSLSWSTPFYQKNS